MDSFGTDKYRYILTAGSLVLPKAVYISALHKTDRRDMHGARAFLVHAFFRAVSNEQTIPSVLMGGITNQINRFAIALFEEGSFLHLSDALQQIIVECLLRVQKHREEKKWDRCAANQNKIVRVTKGIYRGRLGSVIARHVLDKRPFEGAVESSIVDGMTPEHLGVAAQSREYVLKVVTDRLPVAAALLDKKCKYSECAELRRVLYMCAMIAPAIPDDLRMDMRVAPPVEEEEPTMQTLCDIGVMDCHVKGKQNAAAWTEFLESGCRVVNITPFRIFGLTYADLEKNYVDGKEEDVVSGKAQHYSQKPKAKRKAEVSSSGSASKSARVEQRDIDLFEVEDGDRILGFKNATTCGRLLVDVPPFRKGERVFIKIGESESDCLFSQRCYEFMRAMDMPCVRTAVVHGTFSYEWWKKYATDTDSSDDNKWSIQMLKKMSKSASRVMPIFIASQFLGQRLQYVPNTDPRLATECFGRTLAHCLLFSKRVGAKDLGAFNMMVDAAGNVMQVDLNAADSKQLVKFNEKGLQTSHKFDARFWKQATAYVMQHPHEFAAFMRKLVDIVPLATGVEFNLFSDTCIESLRSDARGFVNAW